VVCDRIVKLVLGDVGLEFEGNGGKRKMEKARGSRGGQVNRYERVGVGIRM
jgi:hypothetical protein